MRRLPGLVAPLAVLAFLFGTASLVVGLAVPERGLDLPACTDDVAAETVDGDREWFGPSRARTWRVLVVTGYVGCALALAWWLATPRHGSAALLPTA